MHDFELAFFPSESPALFPAARRFKLGFPMAGLDTFALTREN